MLEATSAVDQAQAAQDRARSGSLAVEETVGAIRAVEHKAQDLAAVVRNWSSRPWFQQPVETRSMAVSEVYVSSATGENCITVSAPIQAVTGELLGVLGVDVNLGRATAEGTGIR